MLKRVFPILLCLCISIPLFSVAVAKEISGFAGGQGTIDAPYLIENSEQLIYFAEQANSSDPSFRSAHYRLTHDINLSGQLWTPIGSTTSNGFSGVFDGGGQSINGLYVDNSTSEKYAGLFGVVDGGTVKNLTVEGQALGYIVGGLIGLNRGGTVLNCVVNCTAGKTQDRHSISGGIVAINDGGRIENSCYLGRFAVPIVGSGSDYTGVANCFTPGDTRYTSTFSDGTATYVDGNGVAMPITDIASLLAQLNTWVDAQKNEEYRRWGLLPPSQSSFQNHFQVASAYPVFGNYVISVTVETGGYLPINAQSGFSVSPEEPTGGHVLSGVSSIYASATPAIKGTSPSFFITSFEGYRLFEVVVDGITKEEKSIYTFQNIQANHTLRVRVVREGNMAHFTESTPYVGYTDVDENAWYGMAHEKTVQRVTAFGLFKGVGDGNFAPDAEITLAEAVKLAATIRSIYRGDKYPFDQPGGTHWYDNYVEYAVECGIINATDFDDFSRPATRAEMAYVLCRALPNIERTQRSSLSPPDMSNGDLYYSYVSSLYLAGVLHGSDSIGTFRPQAYISRVETAAIVARLVMQSK